MSAFDITKRFIALLMIKKIKIDSESATDITKKIHRFTSYKEN